MQLCRLAQQWRIMDPGMMVQYRPWKMHKINHAGLCIRMAAACADAHAAATEPKIGCEGTERTSFQCVTAKPAFQVCTSSQKADLAVSPTLDLHSLSAAASLWCPGA